MGDSNPSLITQSYPFEEVFVNLLSEFFVLLDLMVGLCEGTTTSAAKGTERKPLLFCKGQIAGGHEEISVAVNGFDRVTAAAEVRDIREAKAKLFSYLPCRDFIIQGPDRDGTTKKEGNLKVLSAILCSVLHDGNPVLLISSSHPQSVPVRVEDLIPSVFHFQNRTPLRDGQRRRGDPVDSS